MNHKEPVEIYGLHNCDILAGLAKLETDSVDLIVTSPPYNNWRNKRTQKRKEKYWNRTKIEYDGYDDKKTDEEYAKWQINILNECMRVLKPTGTLCYNHKDQVFNFNATSPLSWILQSNAVFRQRITWDRGGMQAFNNVRFYRREEDIYILGKQAKGFKWNKGFAKYMSIWRITPSRKKDHNGHPAPFPIEIPKRCIESFTNEGDVVLDPFMGSGTTAVAAQRLNRKYIGFEQSKSYYDNSLKWLEEIKNESRPLTKSENILRLLEANPKMKFKEAKANLEAIGVCIGKSLFNFLKGRLSGYKACERSLRKRKK